MMPSARPSAPDPIKLEQFVRGDRAVLARNECVWWGPKRRLGACHHPPDRQPGVTNAPPCWPATWTLIDSHSRLSDLPRPYAADKRVAVWEASGLRVMYPRTGFHP